jgi:hypothetical protein
LRVALRALLLLSRDAIECSRLQGGCLQLMLLIADDSS